MTHSMLTLRQRLRLGAGPSAEAWQRPLSHIVRDHFDDLEEHVRMGFRHAQLLAEIEAVRLEQFFSELARQEQATKRRLSVDPKDQRALAQLQAIAGYRLKPPFGLINQRSFGEAMYDERKARKKAGTYQFAGPRIVLRGVRARQLFVEFDEDSVVQIDISDKHSGSATTPDVASDLPSREHGSESPTARGARPDAEPNAAVAGISLIAPATSDELASKGSDQQPSSGENRAAEITTEQPFPTLEASASTAIEAPEAGIPPAVRSVDSTSFRNADDDLQAVVADPAGQVSAVQRGANQPEPPRKKWQPPPEDLDEDEAAPSRLT